MATLSDVAALAGVSISAVSRVLSDAPSTRVRPETRERIQAAARTLEYRPNFAGRSLKLARSNVIALIVPDLTNAVFTELMQGVEEAALERDYLVLLGRAEGMQPGGGVIPRLIGEGRIDGMLVQLGDNVERPDVEALLHARVPVIFINSIEDSQAGAVVLHDEEGARMATQHLIDLGHSRIGLIGGTADTFTSLKRERGFRAAMMGADLPVRDEYHTALGYEPVQGRSALRALMSLAQPPTAIFVANLNAAIGALAEARALGVRVPTDLSVVAMHDAWTAENTAPPLTTVRMPLRELGRRGVQSLHDRLNNVEVGNFVVTDPPPQIVIRESTAVPSGIN